MNQLLRRHERNGCRFQMDIGQIFRWVRHVGKRLFSFSTSRQTLVDGLPFRF